MSCVPSRESYAYLMYGWKINNEQMNHLPEDYEEQFNDAGYDVIGSPYDREIFVGTIIAEADHNGASFSYLKIKETMRDFEKLLDKTPTYLAQFLVNNNCYQLELRVVAREKEVLWFKE